jgi:UDP-N-acetylmuramate: L-alanyl-gamma-D-glutamyl-meso-diaminopimelate ligase
MVPADQRLDADRVVAELRARGVDARAEADVDRLVGAVAGAVQPGDVVLVMSNGAFGGFIDRLLAALRRSARDA